MMAKLDLGNSLSPQPGIPLTQSRPKRLLPSSVIPIRPPVVVRSSAPIPVQVFRQSPSPVPLIRAPQPKVPIFESIPDRLIIPLHGGVRSFMNGARHVYLILFEKNVATMKSFTPEIFLRAE